jgi:hypothetical protein
MCLGVIIDGVLDWMIGFVALYKFTLTGTTGNYRAIADLYPCNRLWRPILL